MTIARPPPASGAGPSRDPGELSLPVSRSCPQDVLTCQTSPAAAIPAGPSLLAVLSLSESLFLKRVLCRYLQVKFHPPAPQAGPSSPGHIHHWPPELLSLQVQWCPCVLFVQVLRCPCVSRPSVLLSPSVSRPGAVLLSLPSCPLIPALCPMYIFVL